MSEQKITYEKHPVSAQRKAELRKQGLKIVDAKFDPKKADKKADPKADTKKAEPKKADK